MEKFQLLDCFIPLMAFMQQFRQQPDRDAVALAGLIDDEIDKARQLALAHDFSMATFDNALFAVAAWIDEVLLGLQWSGTDEWTRQLKQRRYFQLVNAGDVFYERLDALESGETAVRTVYFYCLSLGFAGRYGYDRKQVALADIRGENINLLLHGRRRLSRNSHERLFPSGYQHGEIAPYKPPRSHWSKLTWCALTLPVLILALIFFFILWQQADSIWLQIRL